MSNMRQNLATKEWVVVAEGRSKKPSSFSKHDDKSWVDVPEHDKDCPFCPGNESKDEEIHFEIKDKGKWKIKVVENRYPALGTGPKICGVLVREKEGPYMKMAGCGHHDVFIEHPQHNQTLGTMSESEVFSLVQAYHRRFNDVKDQKDALLATIFRNNGPLAGASLRHPHSQLVSIKVVPLRIRTHLFEAQHYFDIEGRCAYCDMLKYELEAKKRLVYENEKFVAFVPFAAGKAYEVWLMPKEHKASFGDINEKDLQAFGNAMSEVARRYYKKLDRTAYNYVLRTSPFPLAGVPFYHWYVKFIPRLKNMGSFEAGTGIQVSSVSPEKAAEVIK